MKQIRSCAMVLGLLACAVVATAENVTANVQKSGAPVSGAQVLVLGLLKPVEPYTTANDGTVQMALDLGNITNKTVEITVEQCGDNPPIVYVVFVGGQLPPEKPNCTRRRTVAIVITGSGIFLVDVATLSATFTPFAPAPGPGLGEEPSRYTFAASLLGGPATAENLSTTSAIEGDGAFFFGPVASCRRICAQW